MVGIVWPNVFMIEPKIVVNHNSYMRMRSFEVPVHSCLWYRLHSVLAGPWEMTHTSKITPVLGWVGKKKGQEPASGRVSGREKEWLTRRQNWSIAICPQTTSQGWGLNWVKNLWNWRTTHLAKMQDNAYWSDGVALVDNTVANDLNIQKISYGKF